ncbi:MAG: hypothetical protein AB1489_26645 [Acidobacteriota bacterium]
MVSKVLVTIGILVYGLVVPMLELNNTHVFNPDWVPHARIHEVWQLTTNTSVALFCLWLVWIKKEIRLPSALAMLITGGFLFAYAIQDIYGGSMKHSDGSEKTLMGLNIGLVGFGLVFIISIIAIILNNRRRVV